jgi:hypothetical protein
VPEDLPRDERQPARAKDGELTGAEQDGQVDDTHQPVETRLQAWLHMAPGQANLVAGPQPADQDLVSGLGAQPQDLTLIEIVERAGLNDPDVGERLLVLLGQVRGGTARS